MPPPWVLLYLVYEKGRDCTPMVTYRCDGCGRDIPKKALRYNVEIDVRAAYDKLEVSLMDLVRDHREELLARIEKMKHGSP